MQRSTKAASLRVITALMAAVFILTGPAAASDDLPPVLPKITADGLPNTQFAVHNVGRIAVIVSNFGTIGAGAYGSIVINGEEALSCEYPIHSNTEYLNLGALWIGAVVGDDTLVSVGNDGWYNITELLPGSGAAGTIQSRSNIKARPDYDPEAVSEQDLICTYTDTITNSGWVSEDPIDNRPHKPLPVAVRQASYAWSYPYAEDFIILDYRITNIGTAPLHDVYLGFYIDAAAFHKSNELTGTEDDICGFKEKIRWPTGICLDADTTTHYVWEDYIHLAWIADNDGDPASDGSWNYASARAATGLRVLRAPSPDFNLSFNWWTSDLTTALDFGPRRLGTAADPFRRFGPQLGTPLGDRNKYYMMSRPGFDYDQLFTAVSHMEEGFMGPPDPAYGVNIADGFDTRYLVSAGPFTIAPGDSAPFTLTYVAGDNFHVNPGDYAEFFDPYRPDSFFSKLNFVDLANNSRWAAWIFDNPGVDSDDNGDSGEFCWNYVWRDTTTFNPDTSSPAFFVRIDSFKTYFFGDRIPDMKGASPPPAPVVRVMPGFGSVMLRWNGLESETTRDAFTGRIDFEGYRVYFAEGDRESDYVLLATCDRFNYQVYQWDEFWNAPREVGYPLSPEELAATYGSDFNPALHYDETHLYIDPATGRQLFVLAVGWNQDDLTNPDGIHRAYPDALPDNPADTTEEGYQRYYEYEYTIDNLQPSRAYNFTVTAYDYGSAAVGLGALESSRLLNAVHEYPLPSSAVVEENGLAVMVFPNPYRADGGYARAGYENRERTTAAEWAREIHFANLPRVCTIRIYTLNGDLVEEIEHNRPDDGPGSQHEVWNLISRNTQAVTTGIYLWQVSSAFGDQLGKLVIIK